MKKRINITHSLAIVSILGFSAVVTQAFFNFDIDSVVNGLIFIIIGSGLMLIGSIWSMVEFRDGLNTQEISNIMLTVVGGLSIFVGLFELPISLFSGWDIPAFEGIKATVALFAIIFIAIEAFLFKR